MSPRKQKRKSPFSLLELVLVISVAALATATILPSVRLTQEAIAVERAARSLEKVEAAIAFILKTDSTITNRLSISLDMIEAAFSNTNLSLHIPPPTWPPEAVRDSFYPGELGNPTINVRLKAGETKVSIEDISTPHTPRQQNVPSAVHSPL